MIVYQGDYLQVKYEEQNDRFVNSWSKSPASIISFKSELLQYLKALEKINPSQILWLQENFTFKMDNEIKVWVENEILIPRYKAGFVTPNEQGFHPMAIVVGKDVLSYMEVMGLFDAPNPSVFKPRYFATEQEAREWLNGNFTEYLGNPEFQIIYKGINDQGQATFEVLRSPKDISNTIKLFRGIMDKEQFIKDKNELFSQITQKEREVLTLIASGMKHQEAADTLRISIHTVRDHLKSIRKKLKISSNSDLHQYHSAFLT